MGERKGLHQAGKTTLELRRGHIKKMKNVARYD